MAPLLSSFLLPYTGRDKHSNYAEKKGVKNETANSNNHTRHNRNRHRRLRLHLRARQPSRIRMWSPGGSRHAAASILARAARTSLPARPTSRQVLAQVAESGMVRAGIEIGIPGRQTRKRPVCWRSPEKLTLAIPACLAAPNGRRRGWREHPCPILRIEQRVKKKCEKNKKGVDGLSISV